MKRNSVLVRVSVLAACMSLSCILSCGDPQAEVKAKPEKHPAAAKPPPGWIVAYTNDFSAGKPPKDWLVIDGEVEVVDGALLLKESDLGDAHIILTEPKIGGSVRVELEASLIGDEVSDLSPMLNTNEMGYPGGYLLQFGGGGNTENRIRRSGEIIDSTINTGIPIEPGRKYHILAENDGGKIRLVVDGTEVLTYEDPSPLKGADHDKVGLYTYGCTLRVEKITVYRKVGEASVE